MDFSTKVNTALCILSLILAAISVITVIITIRQNHSMIENATRPYVAVYGQDINSGSPIFYLVVKNFGSSPAIMKKFTISPNIQNCYRTKKGRDFLTDLSSSVLAPGQSRICAMDYSRLPDLLSFELEYSFNKKTYKESFCSNIKAGSAMLVAKCGTGNDLHAISYTLQEILQKQL